VQGELSSALGVWPCLEIRIGVRIRVRIRVRIGVRIGVRIRVNARFLQEPTLEAELGCE